MIHVGFLKPHQFFRLVRSDAQNVSRDPILMLMIALSLVAPATLFYFRDGLDAWAIETIGVAGISEYASVISVIMPAVMIGWVAGFLLLEDRDDGPLLAIETTPVGKIGFIAYRLVICGMLSAGISLIAGTLVLNESWIIRIALSVLVGLDGAIVALILLAFARNKVEGLALSKVINIGILVPLLACVPSIFRYLGGFFPTYWLGEMFIWSNISPAGVTLSLLFALTTHLAWLIGMTFLTAKRLG